jgi:DNA polymerase-3 subunit epsilon
MAFKRQIVLDTETTGIRPEDGHRIVEIGCVELIDGKETGVTYQVYLNPDRESDPEALKVHGLTSEFLRDKPRFVEKVDEFLEFIKDSELIIHNAKFDIKHLNAELNRVNKGSIWNYVKNVVDTLELDKRLFPDEKKHSLDAICERFGISLEGRELHGALIDTTLLAKVYIEINNRFSKEDIEADLEQTNWVRPPVKRFNISLPKVKVTEEDENSHMALLENIKKVESVEPVFLKTTTTLKM